jgi:hypothetical protein
MKRILRILLRSVVVLLTLIVLLWVALQLPPVQTAVVRFLTEDIAEETGYGFSIGRVDLRFPTEVVLRDITVTDLQNDTLLSSEEIGVGGIGDGLLKGQIAARKVSLRSPIFNLTIAQGDSTNNLDPLVSYFSGSDSSSSGSTEVAIDAVEVRNGRFYFTNENRERNDERVDFDHIGLDGLELTARNFFLSGDTIATELRHLSFIDQSGFQLNQLRGMLSLRDDTIRIDEMELRTPKSDLRGHFQLASNGWDDYQDFVRRVKMDAHFNSASVLDFNDLAYFATDLKGLDRRIRLEGNVRGRVSNLKGRDLFIGIDEQTWFSGSIDLSGLPDIEQTFIDLTIDELQGVKSELDQLPLPPFDQQGTLKTPSNFTQLGKMSFKGKFTGFLNDFVAYGTLSTAIGKVRSDIKLQETGNTYGYNGSLETIAFDLGAFYLAPELGTVSSNVEISGSGLTRKDLDATIDGRIRSLTLQDYTYTDITASGAFRENYFSGDLVVNDENAQLVFNGLIDFRKELPLLDFETSISHLDPIALNLVKLQDYTSISGDFRMEAEGLDLDKINGSVTGKNILFCTLRAEYPVDMLNLQMYQKDGRKTFTLNSDIASGRLEGKFDFKGLESGIRQIVADIVPQIEAPDEKSRGREDFYLQLDIHTFELVSKVFVPEMELSEGSRFQLLMDDEEGDFEAVFTTDHVAWKNYVLDTVIVDISHPDNSLYVTVLSDRLQFGEGGGFNSVSLDMRNEADTVYTNLTWGDTPDLLRGDFGARSVVVANDTIENELSRATLWFNDNPWTLKDTSNVRVAGKQIDVDRFYLSHNGSYIKADGTISENPKSKFNVDVEGFNLAMLNQVLAAAGIQQEGIVTGIIEVQDLYNTPLVTSDVNILGYAINDYLIGDLCAESVWIDSERKLRLAGEIEREELKHAVFSGHWYPDRKRSPLDMTCELDELPLAFVNAFISEGISEIDGQASGKIAITGELSSPQLKGKAQIEQASLKVDYLNTRYYFEEEIEIYPDAFWLDFPITDEEGNSAFAAGTVLHEDFSKWNFDVYLDMEEQPFLCLNTTEDLNSLYYGKAYATGWVTVFGTDENLEIDINARSERNTELVLPLGGAEEVTFEDFITFVDYSNPEPEVEEVDLSGISLNFELDITPEAKFRIVFDELVGDEISGRGQGHITMGINNLNTFNMYGDVELTEGNYLFTLKNLINKAFEVEPGGRISWYGDPLAADIDLKAIYKVNTSIRELMPDESEQYRQRIPVNLVMNLDGKLMSPGIRFDIQLPTADELTQARVESVINNEQEMNRQAFALLVLRRFISPPDIAKSNSSIGLAENSTELLSSQLSNWLSQISDDFDIGVNYSPGDQLTNEELAVALSTQLFNDRLLISGNFGVSHAQNASTGENPNSLIGDLRVEYLVTPEGKIRLIVYNESNQFDLANTQQSNYTQGVGIVYQEEFDSLNELFQLK